MNAAHKQKLMIVVAILGGSALAAALLLRAFDQGLNVYFTPSEVAEGKVKQNQNFYLGGMVKVGSVVRQGKGTTIEFVTTDFCVEVPVSYTGVLPDLFREKQGVVALGKLDSKGMFQASEIVAKHDENYMPPQAKAAVDAAAGKQGTPLCQPK